MLNIFRTPLLDRSPDSGAETRRVRPLVVLVFATLLFLLAGSASAHYRWWNSSGFADSSDLISTWQSLSLSHLDIREWAIDPDGEWVIVAENNALYFSSGFPTEVRQLIQGFAPFGIDAVAFAPDGEYVVTAGPLVYLSAGVPNRSYLESKIMEGRAYNGNRISELAFTANGSGWVVSAGGWAWYHNCPSDLADAVEDVIWWSDREITSISIGLDGRWALVADHWFASSDVSSGHLSAMQSALRNGREISNVAVGPTSGYMVYSNGNFQASNDMERVELDLDGDNIYQRMHDANVAGISVAVIKNNEVRYARGYGVLEADTQEWVRYSTPFDLASLSKYLGALTMMTLVDDGMLSLNSDAFFLALQNGTLLHDWAQQLSDPAPQGLYLYRLLSHTASIEPQSSTSVSPSNWPTNGISTLDLLKGYNGSSYSNSRKVIWDPSLGLPGSAYDYSGGGFLLAEAMAEQVTGEDFGDLMQNRVFDALGLADTTASQPLSSAWEDRAAEMHNSSGTPRTRTIYPWHSAGGVYASAADYAKAMIVLLRDGLDEDGDRLISPWLAAQMRTDYAPGSKGYGLGVSVNGDKLSHSGSHGNRASTQMFADRGDDNGIVVLVNGQSSAIDDLVDDIVDAFKSEF